MTKIAPDPRFIASDEAEDGVSEPDFKPLSAEEAQQWRSQQVAFRPWRLLGLQALAGLLVSLLAWGLTGLPAAGWSAAYGAAAVLLPAALMARGMQRTARLGVAGAAMAGFLFWELVKIALTVAMLFAAPKVVVQLNWLALLAGFVVTMKTYWIALMRSGRSRSN